MGLRTAESGFQPSEIDLDELRERLRPGVFIREKGDDRVFRVVGPLEMVPMGWWSTSGRFEIHLPVEDLPAPSWPRSHGTTFAIRDWRSLRRLVVLEPKQVRIRLAEVRQGIERQINRDLDGLARLEGMLLTLDEDSGAT